MFKNSSHPFLFDIAIIFFVALAARLLVVFALPANDSVFWDQPYWHYAKNFSEGKGFWMPNPYSADLDIPRAYAFRPPLFPFLWGCAFRITRGVYLPVRMVFACLGSLTCVLAYLVGLELFSRRGVSLLGALMSALYPPLIWHSVHLMTEPLFIFFSALCVYALLKSRSCRSMRWIMLAGTATGLGVLSRSVLIGFFPLASVWLWWTHGRNRRALMGAIFYFSIMLLVMSPWIIRNAVVLRAFVPTTTDVGHGFYAANNPHSLGDPRGFWIPHSWAFLMEPSENRVSEVEASRRLTHMALRFLANNPMTAMRLMARRFLTLWGLHPHPRFVGWEAALVYAVSYIPILPFMLAGLWFAHTRADNRLANVILVDLLIGFTTATHMLILAMMRYREPLMPFLLIYAALGLAIAWKDDLKLSPPHAKTPLR